MYTQDCVLGYSQPSLRDWFRYTLIADLFLASAVQISRSRKANLDKTASVYTHCETALAPGFLLTELGEIPIEVIGSIIRFSV
jgi:hypothetical protein